MCHSDFGEGKAQAFSCQYLLILKPIEQTALCLQADLPLLSEHDVNAIREITKEFEIDFVSLTFTRDGQDIEEMRDFLDKLGLEQTKILAKVCPTMQLCLAGMQGCSTLLCTLGLLSIACIQSIWLVTSTTCKQSCVTRDANVRSCCGQRWPHSVMTDGNASVEYIVLGNEGFYDTSTRRQEGL